MLASSYPAVFITGRSGVSTWYFVVVTSVCLFIPLLYFYFILFMNTELIIEAIRCDGNLYVSNKKFPCSICNKNVLSNQKAIQCDSCYLWCHIKCDGTSAEIYDKLMSSDETDSWHCLLCKI